MSTSPPSLRRCRPSSRRCAAILKAAPAAEERISYQIAAYKSHGWLFYLGAWKQHYSLYPASESLFEAFCDDLAKYEVEKGTIRFPYDKPVPVRLITAMVRHRLAENVAAVAAKAVAKPAKTPRAKAKV